MRLYPTARQEAALRFMLDMTRELYNAALQERRDAFRLRGISVSVKMQYAELTRLRNPSERIDGRLASVYRECQDASLWRLDLAFAAFFRRCKRGEKPGFPRFKPASRWRQLAFPHGNRALNFDAEQRRVKVPGVGSVRLRKGRRIPKEFGRAWIVCKNQKCYLCVEHEIAVPEKREVRCIVGVDRGVHVLGATSEGELIRNAAVSEKRKARTARLQRDLEARTRRDGRGQCINWEDPARLAAVKRLARAKEREANARRDYAHKIARKIVDSADCIALEMLRIRNMTRSAKGSAQIPGRNVAAKAALNRVILDAGFGLLQRMIVQKAEGAGVTVAVVDARFSSQTCAKCGHCERGNRRRRRFACCACGFSTHADVAAALEIRRRAEWLLSSEPNPAEDAGRRDHDVVA